MQQRTDNILAFTWYQEAEYEKLIEVTEDSDGLAECYKDWLLDARRALMKYKQMGFDPRRVYIDVDAYVDWCESRQRAVNQHSREIYKELRRAEFYRRVDAYEASDDE